MSIGNIDATTSIATSNCPRTEQFIPLRLAQQDHPVEQHACMSAEGWAAVAAWIALIPVAVAACKAYINAGIADARSKRAEDRSEAALSYQERIATALERQAEAAGGRQPVKDERYWVIERRRGGEFALRNLGPGLATNVQIDGTRIAGHTVGLPDGVTLLHNQSETFILNGSLSSPIPGELWIRCDEQPKW